MMFVVGPAKFIIKSIRNASATIIIAAARGLSHQGGAVFLSFNGVMDIAVHSFANDSSASITSMGGNVRPHERHL